MRRPAGALATDADVHRLRLGPFVGIRATAGTTSRCATGMRSSPGRLSARWQSQVPSMGEESSMATRPTAVARSADGRPFERDEYAAMLAEQADPSAPGEGIGCG